MSMSELTIRDRIANIELRRRTKLTGAVERIAKLK